MRKAPLVYLFAAILVVASVTVVTNVIDGTEAHAKHTDTALAIQGNSVGLNNTDFNSNFTENTYDGPATLSQRIMLEYADVAFQIDPQPAQGLDQNISQRIVIEYADYASITKLPVQSYLDITEVSQNPPATNVAPSDVVSINATVMDSLGNITQVSLNYTDGNGSWIAANMTFLQGNIWNSTIPAFPYDTNITYIVVATDDLSSTITTQQLGYTSLHYTVVPEFTAPLIVFLFLMATLLMVFIRRSHVYRFSKKT